MGYYVKGSGDGTLKEGKIFKDLVKRLEGSGTALIAEGDDSETVYLYFDGKWGETEEDGEVKQILVDFMKSMLITFAGEEEAFWSWEISQEGELIEQSLKLTPAGEPTIYKGSK